MRECYGGPLDGELRATEPDGYSGCILAGKPGESESWPHVWLWWPYRCACGRRIAKHVTTCDECPHEPSGEAWIAF